jgi:uncharacterized membrane protein
MSFTNPNALFLLLLLPVFVVVGWPRLAYRRRRDAFSLLVRLVLATLIIVGLAGIQVVRAANKLAVVFLIDVSDSIPASVQSAEADYVRAAAETMGDQDQAAVVVFGADALVETPITSQLELVQIGSTPIRLNTNLAGAIRLGLALFPADTAKRLVILSDGRQTIGNAEEAARLAAATDVQIDYVALSGAGAVQTASGPEVMVAGVDAPSTVNAGERFNLTASLVSTYADSPVEIRVMSGGRVIYRRDVVLQQGTTNEVFEMLAPGTGFVDFQVVIEPRGPDTYYQNNQLSAFTQVTGPPRVLLVTSDPREIEPLRTVLQESGLQVDVQGPHDLPLGLAPLTSYDSIVLANVSATDLTQARMEYLQTYVRDLGRGLVVIGGPDSYGVGGYFKTPLEETLPVEMRIRDQQRIPQLTMLFVIDRSGSMGASDSDNVTKLELAKEAVVRSFDLLNDNDRTGVLSFDVGAYQVIKVQALGDQAHRDQLKALIGSLRPGGGTDIRGAVEIAEQEMKDDPSQLKHIILLTDGGSDPGNIVSMVQSMYQNEGVTLSVVAIGRDYAQWLHDVAAAGHGKFHLAYDISTIPAIFTAETVLATRSYIFEQDFYPTLTARHPIIDGLDSIPPLKGYVASTEKQTATVILRGPEDDPILATWQYGLGRAVAFTSDASSRWAADWIGWDGYAKFWNQAVRWSINTGSANNMELHVIERGGQAVIVADARDTRGDYLNGLNLQAAVTDTNLQTTQLSLQQTAPGRYETTFTPEKEGAYFITVAGTTPDSTSAQAQQSVTQTTGWVLSYSAEYRVDPFEAGQDDPANLLKRIARITGGKSLQGDPQDVFLHNLNQEQAAQPVWHYFVLAALLLLPFDVAIRRLVITPTDLERMREALAAPFRRPPVELPQVSSPRLERLKGAKGRARAVSRSAAEEGRPVAPTPLLSTSEPPKQRTRKRPTALPPAKPAPSPKPTAADQGGTLASKLLERRRASQEQDESKK